MRHLPADRCRHCATQNKNKKHRRSSTWNVCTRQWFREHCANAAQSTTRRIWPPSLYTGPGRSGNVQKDSGSTFPPLSPILHLLSAHVMPGNRSARNFSNLHDLRLRFLFSLSPSLQSYDGLTVFIMLHTLPQ